MKDQKTSERQLIEELERLRSRVAELEETQIRLTNVEKALRESEEKLRLITETIEDVFWMSTPDIGEMIYVSPAYEKLWGRACESLYDTPLSFTEAVHPEDRERIAAALADHAEGHWDLEYRIVRPDGSLRWIQDRGFPIRDDCGNLRLMTGVAKDITDRKVAEEALRHAHDDLELQVEERTAALKALNEELLEEISRRKAAEQARDRLFNRSMDLLCVAGLDGLFKHLNPAWTRTLGWTEEELLSKPWIEFVHPEDRESTESARGKLIDGREVYNFENRYVTKDGSYRWLSWNSFPVPEEGSIYAVARDVTERKNLEEALRNSEERYRVLFEGSPVGILLADVETKKLMYANPAACGMFGYTTEEIGQLKVDDVHPVESLQQVVAEFDAHGRNERVRASDIPCLRKDGSIFYADIVGKPTVIERRKMNVGFFTDITDRKKAEEALERSQAELAAIFNSISDAIVFANTDRRIVRVNRAFTAIWGYDPEEALGRTTEFLYVNRSEYEEQGRKRYHIAAKPEQAPFKTRYRRKDGTIFPTESLGTTVKDSAGNVIGFVGVVRDITDRKKAEDALRRSEEFNRRLVEHAPFGILYVARDGTIEYANPAANRIAGIPDGQVSSALGKRILSLSDLECRPEVRDAFQRLMSGDSISGLEMTYKTTTGLDTVLLVAATPRLGADGSASGGIIMFADISDRERAEELQRQTARYKAVADLAGGVAHNFNNLLHIVMGHLEMALMDLAAGDYALVRESLENVLKSSSFGAEVVRRLQRFAVPGEKIQESETSIFDVSDVARQAAELSQGWLTEAEKAGRKVSIHTRLKEGCLVKADKDEIFGVVVNLVRNSVEALPSGGDVDLTTSVEGGKVVLRVRDTGIGISAENLGRVFNPFFTTKTDPGAGLSLASGRKVVEDCGGRILVDSVEGQGTTFTISIPLAEKTPEPTEAPTEKETERALTILVIDDIEAITDLMKSALTACGHAVLTALSGEEGIEIFKDNPPDVVICDLGMPGMNGWEVGKRISAICQERGVPKTPFILLTAWADQDLETDQIARSGVDAVLGKPLRMDALLHIIADVFPQST